MKLIIYLEDELLSCYYFKAGKLVKTTSNLIAELNFQQMLADCKQLAIIVDSIEEEIQLNWAPKLNIFDRKSFVKHKFIKAASVFQQKLTFLKSYQTDKLKQQQYKLIVLNKFPVLEALTNYLNDNQQAYKVYLASYLIKDWILANNKLLNSKNYLISLLFHQNKLKQLLIVNFKLIFSRMVKFNLITDLPQEQQMALKFINNNNLVKTQQPIKTLEFELQPQLLAEFLVNQLKNPFYTSFYQQKYQKPKKLLLASGLLILIGAGWLIINLETAWQQANQITQQISVQPGLVIDKILLNSKIDNILETTANEPETKPKKPNQQLIQFKAVIKINNINYLQINNQLFTEKDNFKQLKIISTAPSNLIVEFQGRQQQVKIGQVYDLNRWPDLINQPAQQMITAKN